MTDSNEAMTWGIFSLVWLLIVTRAAYHAGRARGAEEERAKLGLPAPAAPEPPPPPPPTLTVTGTIELRDGMTIDEAAEALGVTSQKLSQSLRR